MRAGVEDNHVAFMSLCFECLNCGVVVEGLGGRVEVGVWFSFDTDEVPDSEVICPGGIGDPDISWVEGAGEELGP